MKTKDDLTKDQKAWLHEFVALRAEDDNYFDMNKAEAGVWRETLCTHPDVLHECGDSVDDRYIKDTVLNNIGKSFREIESSDVLEALEIASSEASNFSVEILPNKKQQKLVIVRDKKSANAIVAALGIGTVDTWGAAVSRLEDHLPQHLPVKGIILSAKSAALSSDQIKNLVKFCASLGLVPLVVHPTQLTRKLPTEHEPVSEFSQTVITSFSGVIRTAGYEFN